MTTLPMHDRAQHEHTEPATAIFWFVLFFGVPILSFSYRRTARSRSRPASRSTLGQPPPPPANCVPNRPFRAPPVATRPQTSASRRRLTRRRRRRRRWQMAGFRLGWFRHPQARQLDWWRMEGVGEHMPADRAGLQRCCCAFMHVARRASCSGCWPAQELGAHPNAGIVVDVGKTHTYTGLDQVSTSLSCPSVCLTPCG